MYVLNEINRIPFFFLFFASVRKFLKLGENKKESLSINVISRFNFTLC